MFNLRVRLPHPFRWQNRICNWPCGLSVNLCAIEMYRHKGILSHAKRWVNARSLKVPTALSAAVALTTTAACEPFHPVNISSVHSHSSVTLIDTVSVIPVRPAVKSLWEEVKEKVRTAKKTVQNTVRYIQRVMTYLLYGAPLVGLVPASYMLGESFPEVEQLTWRYLVWAIQHLGPCFIKLAQWASTRPDLFPPSLIEKIEVLQDDVKVNYSMDTVERTLAAAFGSDWKTRLRLDPTPLGSGSVAQVFKGFLKQSKEELEVAIKMIHPHVEQLIRTDMELLSIFADFVDLMPSLEILALGDTCRQFAQSMNLQLDLRLEANHLRTFNKRFSADDWVVFPKPIEGFITKNVLVETLMEGDPIKSFLSLADDVSSYARNLKKKLSDLGCRLILKMVFFDNYIHGDLHPGNILVQLQPNGEPRLVVLDCGIVYSSPTEKEHEELRDICLAFMQHDGYLAGKLMLEKAQRRSLEILSKSKQGLQQISDRLSLQEANVLERDDAFCRGVQQLVIDAESQNYFEHMSDYLVRICDLSRVHNVRLDTGYFKIAMALKVAEGIALALDRNLDLISKCIPIVLKAKAMQAMGLAKFPLPEPEEITDPEATEVAASSN
eukprot:gene8583-9455_t